MFETDSESEWKRLLWIGPLAAVTHVIGQAVAAMILEPVPLAPPQISHGQQAAWGLLSALIIATGMAPLARHLRGRMIARWLVLAVFLYLLNTTRGRSLTTRSRCGARTSGRGARRSNSPRARTTVAANATRSGKASPVRGGRGS